MDELAHELGIDPIELRRINDTAVDPINGKPFSSRSLMPCFDAAAAEFGWSRRTAQPGSMRDGEWRIGWGCATSCYPSNIGPAAARLSLDPSGRAKMQLAGHEIGTGTYTTVAIVVADGLGIPVSKVDVLMGDSELPPVTVAGGSNNAATTAHVAQLACEQIRLKIAEAAVAPGVGIFAGADSAGLRLQDGHLAGPDGLREPLGQAIARAAHGPIEVLAQHTPAGSSPEALAELYQGHASMVSGTSRKDVAAYAFGAHLVEIRVHDMTREVRATRAVSAFAAGVIVNPLTAYSQFMGGAIWGISSALHEATEIDARVARYVNNNLADYLIPVNADVPDLKIIMLLEADHMVNSMGIKGIGEIGIVGMNAAVANAVYHATGKRIRDLPIRLEQLL